MKLWFKKKAVPENNNTKEIEVVQLWYVRWLSHHQNYPYSREKEVIECFTSEIQAREFVESLKASVKILKDSGTRNITLEKN